MNESSNYNYFIKTIRTNNRKEYINRFFKLFLDKNRIIRDPSSSYTPKQKGRAERINQTIFYKIRALIYNANIPLYI